MTPNDFLKALNTTLLNKFNDGDIVSLSQLDQLIGKKFGEEGLRKVFSFWLQRGVLFTIMHSELVFKAKRKKASSVVTSSFTYVELVVHRDLNNLADMDFSEIISFSEAKLQEERDNEKALDANNVKTLKEMLDHHSLRLVDFRKMNKIWNELSHSQKEKGFK